MPDKGRATNTSREDLDSWVQDLLGFHDHLPLFFGRPVIHEVVNVRNNIESDLLCELFVFDWVVDVDGFCLAEKLVHLVFTAARN